MIDAEKELLKKMTGLIDDDCDCVYGNARFRDCVYMRGYIAKLQNKSTVPPTSHTVLPTHPSQGSQTMTIKPEDVTPEMIAAYLDAYLEEVTFYSADEVKAAIAAAMNASPQMKELEDLRRASEASS